MFVAGTFLGTVGAATRDHVPGTRCQHSDDDNDDSESNRTDHAKPSMTEMISGTGPTKTEPVKVTQTIDQNSGCRSAQSMPHPTDMFRQPRPHLTDSGRIVAGRRGNGLED
ncbi:hypothetical protein [Nocardia africana]|uniref:hypothetical protein n=1 Tax=Nocardia africana TaxID=134964 RepID=UPI001D132742|nr:hypothetical protein [Nocardia africana]MCC3311342.1 hypothetical protein [Nocardia africana]